jgi:hypothetical protein
MATRAMARAVVMAKAMTWVRMVLTRLAGNKEGKGEGGKADSDDKEGDGQRRGQGRQGDGDGNKGGGVEDGNGDKEGDGGYDEIRGPRGQQ